MAKARFAILMTQRCEIAKVSATDIEWKRVDPVPDETAQFVPMIVETLRELGYDGSPVALGLSSDACLAATVSLPEETPPNRVSHEVLTYLLEDKLPVSAEQIVADFAPPVPDHPQRRFGVCVPIDRARPLVDALEQADVPIQVLTATTMLAAQGIAAGQQAKIERALLKIDYPGRQDLVTLESGMPTAWSTHADPATAERAVRLIASDELAYDVPALDAAANTAAKSLHETTTPWVNLRRDAFAPAEQWKRLKTPLTFAITALILCLLGVSAIMLMRAEQYRAIADQSRSEQVRLFQQTLPDSEVPRYPVERLRVEHRKQRDLSRAGRQPAQNSPGQSDRSALHHLTRLLDALPTDRRFRVLEIHVEPERIYLDGQARELVDPDAIAQSIRDHGFLVNPPHAERLPDRGVGFVITALPHRPEPQENDPDDAATTTPGSVASDSGGRP